MALLRPASHETIDAREHFIYQEGQSVFKFAVSNMAGVAVEMMKRNNLKSEDISWLVPHQANLRIIDATGRRMGLPPEKVMINIENYGNTTTATIPLCMWEFEKKLKKGDILILAALVEDLHGDLYILNGHMIRNNRFLLFLINLFHFPQWDQFLIV